jgi:3-methylcrotonyl-CoA carboxylase alpha subunit
MKRIRTLLVANRGEIARRILRTCRALGIRTVAVYSEADRELPHAREADCAVCLGPAPAAESYLSSEALLAAAKHAGADAIHPGYGFLSENAAFAQAVQAAGLVWVGPPPEAIRAMGDKARARALAAKLGVPTVPGYNGEVQRDEAFEAAADRLGYPVLVKAAGGGGGRGMRRVDRPGDLRGALAGARREAQAAFGNDTLLLERYLARPRHIEIQVLGDAQGRVVHLFERECSIQRRHQKIIEEAPSPAVTPELRGRLGDAAVRVAKAVGYQSAGTVEFLLDEEGRYHFLEMNTRLQVEHPVTERVTGTDLVALQIAIAEGAPLALGEARLSGHAIEARLYAEDPARDYLPSSGPMLRFDLPSGEGLRVDSGYERGDEVGVHYDPMLAKIVAWGADRPEATRRLRRALELAWVPGVATNLPLLRDVLATEGWESGDLDTHFLERHGLPRSPPLNIARGALAAAALAWQLRRESAPWPREVTPGWRVEGPTPSTDRWHSAAEEARTSWRALGGDAVEVTVSDAVHRVRVLGRQGDVLRAEVDGVRETWRWARRPARGARPHETLEDGDVVYVHLGDAEAVLELVPRHPPPLAAADEPGTCAAPMPGKVAKLHVRTGEPVRRGQALLVLEAMKMEHTLTAPEDGTVAAVCVTEGDTVEQGAVLVRLEGMAVAS